MAESREVYDQSRIDFLHRVQTAKSEIRTKFQNLRNTINNQEERTLEKVEEIQQEILENYERTLTSLKELSQVRDQVLAGLKSNATNDFLRKNLEMYDREIETVKKNSKIDSIFELVWDMEHLNLCDLCEVVSYTENLLPEIPPVPMSRDDRHEETFLLHPQVSNTPTLQPAFPSNKLVQPAFSTAQPNPPFSRTGLFGAEPNPPFSRTGLFGAEPKPPFSRTGLFGAEPKPPFSRTGLFGAEPKPPFSRTGLFAAQPNPTISQSPFSTAPKAPPNQ